MKRKAVFQKAVPYFPQLQAAFAGDPLASGKAPIPEDGPDPARPNPQRSVHKDPGPTPKPSLGVAAIPAPPAKVPGPKGNLISIPRAVVPLAKKPEQPPSAKPPVVQISVQKQQIALPKPSGPGTKKSEETKQPLPPDIVAKPASIPAVPSKHPVGPKLPTTNEVSARSISSGTSMQKHPLPAPESNGVPPK